MTPQTEPREPLEPFGPLYPKLGPAVAKWRKIKRPTPEQRQAHGAAIEAAILALQRAELARMVPTIPPNCASGTWHNNADGKVGEAVRMQHRVALLTCPARERAARTPRAWADMYEQAMAARLAAKPDRSAAARKAWASRRGGTAPTPKPKPTADRSAAARKAWATRRRMAS